MKEARDRNALDSGEELKLEPLKELPDYVPLRETVFLALRKAILDGTLRPGQTLSENRIAASLSVSRTPVRDAIRRLEAEDLVAFLPGRRVIVSVPTEQDIKEIYEIRLIIETEALRRITPAHRDLIQELEDHIVAARGMRERGDLKGTGEANVRFHMTIISALENRRLLRYVDSLYDTISQFRFYSRTPDWAVRGETEHEHIVSYLKDGENEKAVSLLRRHLTVPTRMLGSIFAEVTEGPADESP